MVDAELEEDLGCDLGCLGQTVVRYCTNNKYMGTYNCQSRNRKIRPEASDDFPVR